MTKHLRPTLKQVGLGVLALLITLSAAVYQRLTGPTYPLHGDYTLNHQALSYKLPRTHGGSGDQAVTVQVPDSVQGELMWRQYPSKRQWNTVPLTRTGDQLTGYLPHQPPAGKLEYYLILRESAEAIRIPAGSESAIIRFKGQVPGVVLIPHIILMFLAMLLSNRAGLEVLANGTRLRSLTISTAATLVLGGLVLGPIIQFYAFGQFWTGFPVGHDLTDNKIAIAFLGWIPPLISAWKRAPKKRLVMVAALITFIIFLIPHSMFGSELTWD